MRDLERSSWIDDSRRSRDETDIINRENSDIPGTTDFRTTGIEFDSEIAASHSQGNELMSWSTDIQSPDPSHRRPMSDLD